MARKRQYKKRQDYRKGGRVRYQTGGAPQRKDYDNAREYNLDMAEYRKSQPAQPAVGNIGINRPPGMEKGYNINRSMEELNKAAQRAKAPAATVEPGFEQRFRSTPAVQPGFEQGFLGSTPAAPPAMRENIGSLPEVGGVSQTPFLGSSGGIDLPTQGPVQQPTGGPSQGTQVTGNVGGITQQPNTFTQQPPQGLDSRAIAADPAGYERFLRQAQEQEKLRAGSTFLSQQGQRGQPLQQRGQPVQQRERRQDPVSPPPTPEITPEEMERQRKFMEQQNAGLRDLFNNRLNETPEQAEQRRQESAGMIGTMQYTPEDHMEALASQVKSGAITEEEAQKQIDSFMSMRSQPRMAGERLMSQMAAMPQTATASTASAAAPEKSEFADERGALDSDANYVPTLEDQLASGAAFKTDQYGNIVTSTDATKVSKSKDIYSEGTQADLAAMQTEAEGMRDRPEDTFGDTTYDPSADPTTYLDTRRADYTGSETQSGSTRDVKEISRYSSRDATAGQAARDVDMTAAQVDQFAEAQNQAKAEAAKFTAELAGDLPPVNPATGELSEAAKAKVEEIRQLSGPAVAAEFENSLVENAKAKSVEGTISDGAFVPEVTGVGGEVSATPDAEAKEREGITGERAPDGSAANIAIDTIGYDAAQRGSVKGEAKKGEAEQFLAEVGNLPPEVTKSITDDPVTVTAQIASEDVDVIAAVAALPQEALVSSQMEVLVGGLESGTVPTWARPAVDAINQRMAQRGLDVSTVARDSLFNAIIQSALPIAQSNAQALQARAAQNLSNEQQANLTEATQEQQLRMANLANRQGAETQTAQFAQGLVTQARGFQQEAGMANLQARQQTAQQNLNNEQNIELADLNAEIERLGTDATFEQQRRRDEFLTAADFLSKNAAFKQQMELSNLTNEQQIRLANLSALNQADSESLSNEQQTELANLNKSMQSNLRNAELANSMGIAQLNVDQQRAMQNATMTANMDMAQFNADQQRELANSKFMQTVVLTDFNAEQQSIMQNATALASMDLATVDQRTKIAITNAQSFLQMDMSNLSNDQQTRMLTAQQTQQRLLSDQSFQNAAKQFGATSENQTNQFFASLGQAIELNNASALNAQRQFNVQQENLMRAEESGIQADIDKANAALATEVEIFNSQQDFNRRKWNAANAQAVEQSNINWRRQANTVNNAASNQAAMQNAQNLFNMSSQAQAFLWQELRDRASYEFQAGQKFEDRKTILYEQALANAGATGATYDSLLESGLDALFDGLGF